MAGRLAESHAALEARNRELATALDRILMLEQMKRALDRFVPETARRAIEADPAPPREFWPEVPVGLEVICLKAVAKDPDRRYASAADLAREVQRWQEDQRRRAEEELRRSEERFELAVRGSQGEQRLQDHHVEGALQQIELRFRHSSLLC